MVAGDFNLLLEASDKNNSNINRRNLGRFRRFVNEVELKDVHLHGRSFTWSNERDQPTMSKLDRVLVSVDWEAAFPNCFMQARSTDISDHCPLLLSTNVASTHKRRFHFERFWIKIPGYQEAVHRGWQCSVPPTQPFRHLDELLRNTARELQSWSQKCIGSINLQILIARELILHLDQVQERRALTSEEVVLRKEIKLKCLGLASLQRTIARMRSRITWLKEGDACTKFFQLHAKHRQQRKHISSIQTGTGRAITHDEMAKALLDHFTAIMGTDAQRTAAIDLQAIGVPTMELGHLDQPFYGG